MRFLYFIFLLSLFKVGPSYSQGEKSTFRFSEVVIADSINEKTLARNGKNWFIKHKFQNLDSTNANLLKGEHSFLVYQQGVVSKQLHGKIFYKLSLEIKNNKYRYTFSDFTFHYYKKDRNYNMVPTGKQKPLEETEAPGWQRTWEKHKAYTSQQIQLVIEDLKVSLPVNQSDLKTQEVAEDF